MTHVSTATVRGSLSATTAAGSDAGERTAKASSRWAKTTAGYSASMAVLLVGTWVVLLTTGSVPELTTRPFSTWSLLAAEFATAGFLLAGAAGVAYRREWARRVLLVALGMLLYTTVNTVGVSAEQGLALAAAFMALVATGSAVLIIRSLDEPRI